MTAYPIEENAGCWWLTCGKWRRLHAIPEADLSRERMQTSLADGYEPVPARAACGLRRRWWYPGMFSRLGAPRCGACCAALGIPAGHGTPCNEAALRREETES